jgi:peptide/nickel transport system permease protein
MVVLAAYLPPGPVTIFLVLTVTGWAWNARVFRSQALSVRERDFVAAAIVAGHGGLHVVFLEMLPNLAPIIAAGFIQASVYAIGAQVGLEFIGLGDPSSVSWGTNLYWASNDAALLTGSWWTYVPTGTAIACVGLGLALVNFGIDEVANPRLTVPKRFWDAAGGAGGPFATPVRREP